MKLRTLVVGALLCSGASVPLMAERGSDGELRISSWQAPTTLNPYQTSGAKDHEAASLVLEPLARFDQDGVLVPWLVTSVPTVGNGGVSADLRSITWKIKPGLTWSDGTPFTSADVKFTYDYCLDPNGSCAQRVSFDGVTGVETLDNLTVVIRFDDPTPNPYGPFVGGKTPILQAAQFANCKGAASSSCTAQDTNPIGTGPFVVQTMSPNAKVTYSANPNFRDPAKPAFSSVNLVGVGDAVGAASAVLQTGTSDYAFNLQIAPDVVASLESGGKGSPIAGFGPSVESLVLNWSDPDPALGEFQSVKMDPQGGSEHPFLGDPAVYKAMSMAIDRPLLVEVGYGQAAKVTCNVVPAPALYSSESMTCDAQDIWGANAMLDEAGVVDSDGDGIREKDGIPLIVEIRASTNAVRADFQALIKSWWAEIGIEAIPVAVDGATMFGSGPQSPDTIQKFPAGLQLVTSTFSGTDPQDFLAGYLCSAAPTPSNGWQGTNIARFCMAEFDALHAQLTATADLEERGRIGRELNDMIVQNGGAMPLVHRARLSAQANTLGGVKLNVWDNELSNIADWYRIK